MLTLVTGATGLVGNNVVRELLARGRKVRVLARASSDERPLAGLDVEVAIGDITDVQACRSACENVQQVIHSAALVHIGWSELESQRRINVEGTRNIVTAAHAVGARIVHVSSVDALGIGSRQVPASEDSPREGKTPCAYVLSKREAEHVVREETARGANAVIVNPTLMFGPWDWKPSSGRMILEVARRFTPLAPSGGGNVVDVRDVASGILAAAEKGQPGRNYILGGENLSYFDLWQAISRAAGKRPPMGKMGPVIRFLAGQAGDLAGKWLGKEPVVNSAAIAMSSLFHYYTSARAKLELGYQHRPMVEAIHAALAWFREWKYLP